MNYSCIEQINKIFESRQKFSPCGIKDYMEKLKNQKIVLYGAGAFGSENLQLLRKYGIEPICFLDKKAIERQVKEGVAVFRPDDETLSREFRREVVVYICITTSKETMDSITQYLYQIGYDDVRVVQTITAHQVKYQNIEEENPTLAELIKCMPEIERAYLLMEDDESKETFLSCLRAHLLREYEECYETSSPVQYFDAGVPLKRGYTGFVDCGAYNGDSVDMILKYTEQIDRYIAFEPIQSNFMELSKKVDLLGNSIREAYLFPCGVAEATGNAYFTQEASASTMNDIQQGVLLPIVRIDDVVKNAPVTFLKMDIEGAELAALHGARELISEQMPDLAISVYHFVNHYWDIPCAIYEMNNKYKFYLRSHTPGTLETVLYCVSNQ